MARPVGQALSTLRTRQSGQRQAVAMRQPLSHTQLKHNNALLHRLLCRCLTRRHSVPQMITRCRLPLTVSSLPPTSSVALTLYVTVVHTLVPIIVSCLGNSASCCADDRLVTHWLRVIGKHAPAAPLVDIELTQRADVLLSAKAKVTCYMHNQLCYKSGFCSIRLVSDTAEPGFGSDMQAIRGCLCMCKYHCARATVHVPPSTCC